MSVPGFTRLSQGLDGMGFPVIAGIPQSNWIDALYFSGAGSGTLTFSTDASGRLPNFIVLGVSQNVDIFVKFGSSAAVPSGNITDGSASEANPLVRQVNGNTKVTVAVGAACNVTIAYYS